MSAVPHHVHGFDRAAPEHETPNVVAANAVLALAREAVRMAVEHGGDQAAGALRLLLNELSPIPEPVRSADAGGDPKRNQESADAGGHPKRHQDSADLRLLCLSHRAACREHAKRMRSAASAGQFQVMAETFSTLAAWLEQGGKSDA